MPTPEFWTLPGWRALETALADAFPGNLVAVHRWPPNRDIPSQPLAAVMVHADASSFHYAGLGLSELVEKVTQNQAVSGWGIEYTLRVARAGEAAPPEWPAVLLQRVAAMVLRRRFVFGPHHHVELGAPICDGSRLTALLFARDPAVPPFTSPFGAVHPVSMIGITSDEERLLAEWSAAGLVEQLRTLAPGLVTEPGRGSFLAHPEIGPSLRQRAADEGSAVEGIVPDRLAWRASGHGFEIQIGPVAPVHENLPALLRGRTRLGRPLTLRGQAQDVELRGGSAFQCAADGSRLVVTLSDGARVALEQSIARAGPGAPWTHADAPGLSIVLVDD